ncbi:MULTISPECIES: FtsX-like permease family protein [unclassified Actinomyces]|uniref:ABC transporter permease n=1 Tax=unclassified Actinomyces TaxID=2609248 RepID=UPI001373AF17|nr:MULTISPECIES: FtsX-like permease family protein [unclassified Actinomyces]NDR53053.1 ABC transporter permease [Actinomyces sp. 565]QHO91757.1 ABC transporter permease [Actinomyces sp. 432]
MTTLPLTRLVVAGDRAARRRLAGITAGVMIGVALFLLLAAAGQAFGVRSERSTWTDLMVTDPGVRQVLAADTVLTPETAAAVSDIDHYEDHLITILMVAATPDTRVRIPGSDVVPHPGQYLASPALAELIDAAPADQLGERYGEQVGVLSDDAIEGPDSLVLVLGVEQSRVLAWEGMSAPQVVTEFIGYDYASTAYRIVAIIGAIAVLVPVLLLIAIVTGLGAAQRAERFATLRLIGATPGRVARIAAAETAVTALLGALLGVVLYLFLIPLAARIEIGSSTFFPRDLLTSPGVIGATVVAIPLMAAVVTWWTTLRADVGPLGASRERRERPPRLLSLLPLLLGLAGLTAVRVLANAVDTGEGTAVDIPIAPLLVASFVLTMLGLLWAGPLLTSWAARLVQRRARNAAQVIGLGRMVQHPRAAFRAVGGLVVAVYAVTLFAVAVTAAAGTPELNQGSGYLAPTTLYTLPEPGAADALEQAAPQIAQVEGVSAVVVAREAPYGAEDTSPRLALRTADARALGAFNADSSGATMDSQWVSVSWDWLVNDVADPRPLTAPETDAAATLLVATDGEAASVERARTAVVTAMGEGLTHYPISRFDNVVASDSALENQFAALGYIGILIAAGVSAAALAVSTVSSLLARRRVLSLLRLIGMPHQTLRRATAWEMLLPVITVLALCIGAAVYTAWIVIVGISSRGVGWPAASYYVVLGACLALVGVAVLASTRAASRMVASTTVRFE